MGWYTDISEKMELPETRTQTKIKPTQLIVHSLAAPWTVGRTYEYWRDSTNLESHFGVDYTGKIAQYLDTQVRADANAAANLRADGTGAISVETASNQKASDPWNSAQVDALVRLMVKAHLVEGIPLRLCKSESDPGFGFHRMFRGWNPNGHACPGEARTRQFTDVVLPRAQREVQRLKEDKEVALSDADISRIVVALKRDLPAAVWAYSVPNPARLDGDGKPLEVTMRALQLAEDRHFDEIDDKLTKIIEEGN